MKKMQEKRKIIQIYKIDHRLPLKPGHRDGKHQVQNSRGQQPKHKLSQWQKPNPLKPRQIETSAKLNQKSQLSLKRRTQGFIN
jgi:hypothetical protein